MPTIRITQALQKSMKAAEFEAYLVGSGKPTGVKATVNGEEVSWGEDVAPAPPPAPQREAVDYGKMTKTQIETHVRETYGVELDRRHNKSELIAQALQVALDNGG